MDKLTLPIYCINLAKAKDRRMVMETYAAKHHDFHFVDAIYGDDIPTHLHYTNKVKNKYEIACCFSHLKAIEQAYLDNREMCIFLEDDMEMGALEKWDFSLQDVISSAPPDWEILQLYCNNPMLMNQLLNINDHKGHLWTQWCLNAWSTGLYVLKREGMRKLLDRYKSPNGYDLTKFPHEDRFCAADVLLYVELKSYLIMKPIIWENAKDTYIQPPEHFATFHLTAKKFIVDLYPDKISLYLPVKRPTKVFLNGFWKGFDDKTDGVHIGLWQDILKHTKIGEFQVTNNMFEAHILMESVFAQSVSQYPHWKHKILVSGESYIHEKNEMYDVVVGGFFPRANFVNFPLMFQYAHCQNAMHLFEKRELTRVAVASRFCCFIVSNPNCETRNKMFRRLCTYKKVDSLGSFENNMNFKITSNYWTDPFRRILAQYKFVLCFENKKLETYLTEKLLNPYWAECIPVYWGSDYVHSIFNSKAFLCLENESDAAYQKLIEQIVYLDTHDDAYWEMLRQPLAKEVDFRIETIGKAMNALL